MRLGVHLQLGVRHLDRAQRATLLGFLIGRRTLLILAPLSRGVMSSSKGDARIARALTDTNDSGELAALEKFRGYFGVDEVRTGTEVVFSCGPAGRLATSVGGDERPAVDSRALCRALFDVYLGEDPISDDGKRSVIAGFPGLMRLPATCPPLSDSPSSSTSSRS